MPSFYAEVARAADPLTSLITTSANQVPFDLSTGRQVEASYKRQLVEGKGAYTVAAYRIDKPPDQGRAESLLQVFVKRQLRALQNTSGARGWPSQVQ